MLGKKSEFKWPESAVVIDDDELISRLVSSILKSLGIPKVDFYNNGEAGWKAIEERDYGLVILDWQLPIVDGLTIFNRIRATKRYRNLPVVVISGFLKKEDFRIVSEFSCSTLVEKPFGKQGLIKEMEKTVRESQWYQKNEEVLDWMIEGYEDDPDEAMKVLKSLIHDAPNPVPQISLAGKMLRKAGRLDEAEKVLRQGLEKHRDSITLLTELGNVLHAKGSHREAARLLKAAVKMSPQNIERLVLLGETNLMALKPKDARKAFEDALSIDEDNIKAKAGITTTDNFEQHLAAGNIKAVPRSFASLLNTLAISMVRAQKTDEGIKQYRAALTFLEDRKDLARVYFNLGLASIRAFDKEEARKWFAKSSKAGGKDFAKAQPYVEKLDKQAGISVEDSEEVNMGDLNVDIADLDDLERDASDGSDVVIDEKNSESAAAESASEAPEESAESSEEDASEEVPDEESLGQEGDMSEEEEDDDDLVAV